MDFEDYAKTISGILNITPKFDSERESAAENIYNAALLNLPTCGECNYWKKINHNVGTCEGSGFLEAIDGIIDEAIKEDGFTYISKDFSCKFHSSIEQLRKDNDG